MAPNILTAVTAEQLRYEPELGVYIGLVHETGFDPEALWYPCECLGAFNNQHEDACWLGWIAYPMWMKEPTSEVPIILEVPYTDVDLRVADMLADEDETTYLERHHTEPTSDVDDEDVFQPEGYHGMTSDVDSEEVKDGDVPGEHDEHAHDVDHGRS